MLEPKDKKLLNILAHAVKNSEVYYEEGLIHYILKEINKESLIENDISLQDYSGFKINANFWGTVCAFNYKAYLPKPVLEDFFNTYANQYSEKNYNEALQVYKNQIASLNNWKNLLQQYNIEVTDPIYKVSKNYSNESIDVDLNGWLAITKTKEWIKHTSANSQNMVINEEVEKLLAKEILNNNYQYEFSYLKTEEYTVLVNLIVKNQDYLKENFKTSIEKSKSLTHEEIELTWLDKIFNSQTIRKLLEEGHADKLTNLFNKDFCRTIINKAKLKTNIENNPAMLSNFLAIAKPETWIEAYSTGKNFNLLSFFNPKYKRAYGKNFNSDKYIKYRYPSVRPYIIEELEYLKPALIKANIPDSDRLVFWSKTLDTEDGNLIKKASQCIKLPDIENLANKEFYKRFENEKVEEQGEIITIERLYKIAQYEDLQSRIINKTEQYKRKVKL